MDFFDELIQQLKKEAAKGDSFTVLPETWEVFLDPEKAVKKVETQAESLVTESENIENKKLTQILNLETLQQDIIGCHACPLAKVRKNPAVSYGNPQAKLMIVIENPSLLDDEENMIFAGEVGVLLDKMLLAMGLTRSECYITSIVKCRTPGSRQLEEQEIKSCTEKFFNAEINAVRPECILAFGAGFAKDILHREGTISNFRGVFDSYDGIPVMSTFNPAYLLRQPSAKKIVWGDLQMVMKALGLKN